MILLMSAGPNCSDSAACHGRHVACRLGICRPLASTPDISSCGAVPPPRMHAQTDAGRRHRTAHGLHHFSHALDAADGGVRRLPLQLPLAKHILLSTDHFPTAVR